MTNLTLKQMQDIGIHTYMSDKEISKHIDKALSEYAEQTKGKKGSKAKKELTIDEVLKDGGVTTYYLGEDKYRISVLTPEQLQVYDNIEMYQDEGYEINLPTIFKFHIRTSLGNLFTVKCGTYTVAQTIVDDVFGKGLYKVSCSKL